ncbi:MAG: AAA family ATPase, partial [Deltaproteobacteria bacterium]|nr:AAA family ATPase [Deltaproteobacteria bacterium]
MIVGQEDRYCRQCGCSLARPRKEEHRYVTVLFSDLSGYSVLAEELDPEDLQEVVGRIFREAATIITSYEGIIEKFIGDAIVAIFGVGRTHEDDAVRAILSALDIHSIVEKSGESLVPLIGRDLNMHSGINTGEVFVGSAGADPFNHGALGAPINIASRLSDMARPGEILIGESLVFEARRFFQLEYLGKMPIKGFRENSGVYRVVSPRETPLALHRDRGRVAQMIGRENQLKALERAAKDVRNQKGSVVCVSGDPGVGKSRLLQEFKNFIAGDIPWFETRCFDFAKDSPYLPFSALIRQLLGLKGDGLPFQKVKAKIASIMNSEMFAPLLASLCCDEFGNIETKPDVWKSKLFDAVSFLLQSFASRQPIIVCFEDIHWADQSTLDLLRYLLNYPQIPYPCLFLISFRSQPSIALSGIVLRLKDLSKQETRAMAESLIPDKKPNADTFEYLFNATGGNPFYLEEMVNYLIDRGSSLHSAAFFRNGGEIPSTITGLIAARLDSLSPKSRCIIQEASAIGRLFPSSLLCSISFAPEHVFSALDELVDAGFIDALGRDEYTFRHALTQEVCYANMLKRERKLLHEKMGAELESRYLQNLDSVCDVLAYHFSRSPDEKRAIRYSIQAAQKSQKAGSWVEAAEHYRIADNILQRQHDDLEDRQNKLISVWEGMWNCTRIFNPDKAIYAL